MAGKRTTPSAEGLAAQRAAIVTCWLCGIRLPNSQMVPDGGGVCADIRWYCRDIRGCTGRWPSARRPAQPAGVAGRPVVAGGRHQRR